MDNSKHTDRMNINSRAFWRKPLSREDVLNGSFTFLKNTTINSAYKQLLREFLKSLLT